MKNGLYLLTVLFLAACTNDNKQTTEQQDTTVAELTYWDSIQEYDPQKMNLVIDGKQMELVYFKQNEDMVFKALEIEKMDDPFHQISELKYDVTNDGVDDSIIFYINKLDTFGFEKGIRIFSNNRLVFHDSAIADSSYFDYAYEILFNNDSSFYKLLPYSLLSAIDFGERRGFFDDFHASKFMEDNSVIITSFIKSYSESTSEDPLTKQRDMMIYLNVYSGKSFADSFIGEDAGSLLIWYAPDSCFVPIYAP